MILNIYICVYTYYITYITYIYPMGFFHRDLQRVNSIMSSMEVKPLLVWN